jgi:hypothetical protein
MEAPIQTDMITFILFLTAPLSMGTILITMAKGTVEWPANRVITTNMNRRRN